MFEKLYKEDWDIFLEGILELEEASSTFDKFFAALDLEFPGVTDRLKKEHLSNKTGVQLALPDSIEYKHKEYLSMWIVGHFYSFPEANELYPCDYFSCETISRDLKGIPENISNIKHVKGFRHESRYITRLPSALFTWDLDNLKLYQPPVEDCAIFFEKFPNIRCLTIYFGNFPNGVPNLSKMKNLNMINLVYCELKEMPPSLGDLNLNILGLEHNKFKHVPKGIEVMTNLYQLTLAGNKFRSFPEEILELPRLQSLTVTETKKFPKATLKKIIDAGYTVW